MLESREEEIENKKLKPLTGHFQFLVFYFQNIEEWCLILPFLATKIENWDCKFLIFNFWGIKHWKSRLWSFDFQFSILNENQMDENHTDLIAGKYALICGMEIQKIQMVVHIFSRFAFFTELMWQLMWPYRRVESLFKLFTANNVPFHLPKNECKSKYCPS